MDALLTGVPWQSLGPGGVLVLAVLLIIRGDLVPRKTHETIVAYHRESNAHLRASNARLEGALSRLADEHGTTTDRVLNALPRQEERSGA